MQAWFSYLSNSSRATISVALTKLVQLHNIGKNCIMVHGITCKSGCSLPPCILQEKLKNQKETEKVRGFTKEAVLDGDAWCPNLIAFSVYNTKPMQFLSISCTELKWIEEVKIVFAEKGRKCVRFLGCNINGDFNNGMNRVDIANQPQGDNHIDCCMHKQKWW